MSKRILFCASPALVLTLLAGCSSKPSAPGKGDDKAHPTLTANSHRVDAPKPGVAPQQPAVALAPNAQPTPVAHPVPPPAPPPVAAQPPRPPRGKLLSIIYTANAQGEVEPCG